MRKPEVLLGLLAAVCAGCLPDKPASDHYVYLDTSFTVSQQEVILGAFQDWEERTGTVFHLSIAEYTCDRNCNDVITIHPSTIAELSSLGVSSDVYGLTLRSWHNYMDGGPRDFSNVYIASDMPSADYRQVVLHEIGHTLGLSHAGDGTIMCYHVGCQASDITAADVQQYDSLR